MIRLAPPPPPPPRAGGSDLHHALKSATADVHARLHEHTGLARITRGEIRPGAYRKLLLRLYGFYLPFEKAARLPSRRSDWLAQDLITLDTPRQRCDAAARCSALPHLDTELAVLGAMYMVEGSALGGHGLARRLGPLLANDSLAGRRFFASNGSDTGSSWRAYLARLHPIQDNMDNCDAVISSAIATFASFETWLAGWEADDDA